MNSAGPRSLSIQREDGAEVFAAHYGALNAGRVPVLILDGIGCSGWAFRRLLPSLARRRAVLLVHYRGHGNSPVPPRPWRFGVPDLADDAAALCRKAGLSGVLLVGFSMGFQIGLELYRRHRDLASGLFSLAGPAGHLLKDFQRSKVFSSALPAAHATSRILNPIVRRLWQRITTHELAQELGHRTQVNSDRVDPQDLSIYLHQLSQVDPELFLYVLSEAQRHTAFDLLQSIDIPTSIIAGSRDHFVPLEVLREMAFRIPGSEWEVIPEASHALPAEFPLELVERIESLCTRLEARAR